jgi:hypothetical protein
MRPRLVVLNAVIVVAAAGLVASGCGGGGNSPGVATLAGGTDAVGTTTTQSGSGSAPKGSGGPRVGPGGQFEIGMNVGAKDGPKFSACMRKHGVPSFPDPNSQGVITIHSGMGIDPSSPAFQSARSTCEKLLPNGGQPTPAQIAQQQQKLLEFSACMRAHGIKDFPDPSNGGLRLSAHPGSDLSPDNPTFQKAQQACQKYMPFKGGPTTAKAGGG